jgi:fatty acid desaturase
VLRIDPLMKYRFFRFKEDRLPISLFVGLFALDLLVFFTIDSRLAVVLWFAITLAPRVCICSWNHHHQHLATFKQKFLNRLLEIVYALQTGITTNAWVLHHNLGHHLNYLDQTKDESGWKRKDGKIMTELEYTWTIALTGYLRAIRVGRRYPKYEPTFWGMGILVATIMAGLFYLSWFNTLVIFFVPMLIGYVATCWHTYAHHAGLDTDDPFHASHNVMDRLYNIMTGNLGYHTAHHIKPGLHWSQLPEYHASIAERIPQELFVMPPAPFRVVNRVCGLAGVRLVPPIATNVGAS